MELEKQAATRETESRPGRRFDLPLAVLGFGDKHKLLRDRLFLVEKFRLGDARTLVSILKKRQTGSPLSAEDGQALEHLWQQGELDDLDLAELFVAFLPQVIDRQSSKQLEGLDPQPTLHKRIVGSGYDAFIRNSVRRSAAAVGRYVLPRVRAKLSAREIVCLLTTDPKRLSVLVGLTPRYLSCPMTANMLAKLRITALGGKGLERQQATKALTAILRGLNVPNAKQPRQYGYWRIDYFFNELLACIRIANEITDSEQRREYVRTVDKVWGLPNGYAELLAKGVKRPTEVTLEIMVAKRMITDPSTYRNVIKPHVKKIKAKYPYLRACDALVEHLLDLPTRLPDKLATADLWTQLESFRFDLTDEELAVGQSVSYPTTRLMV